MTSGVVPAQGLPLWAMALALIQNQTPNRFPDGTASLAKLASGCEPVPSNSRAPPRSTRRELSSPIPRQPASRPAIASDAAGLGFGFLPAGLFPAVIPAIPTMSAIPTTVRAIAADFAIHSHGVRSGSRSRARSRPKSNAGRALQESLLPHTTATDAASPANGSSYGRNPGRRTAAPKRQSIPRSARRPVGYSSHAPAPAPVHHRAPVVRIVYRIAAEALQPKAPPHLGHIAARRQH
jgi:hypothetical protein